MGYSPHALKVFNNTLGSFKWHCTLDFPLGNSTPNNTTMESPDDVMSSPREDTHDINPKVYQLLRDAEADDHCLEILARHQKNFRHFIADLAKTDTHMLNELKPFLQRSLETREKPWVGPFARFKDIVIAMLECFHDDVLQLSPQRIILPRGHSCYVQVWYRLAPPSILPKPEGGWPTKDTEELSDAFYASLLFNERRIWRSGSQNTDQVQLEWWRRCICINGLTHKHHYRHVGADPKRKTEYPHNKDGCTAPHRPSPLHHGESATREEEDVIGQLTKHTLEDAEPRGARASQREKRRRQDGERVQGTLTPVNHTSEAQ
ncbi:hypothetical protein F4780DRAFT_559146 [Xylariomycetidae sp. FL0641]|nr:hypothetical protein F4780DRAFT_559146 [Xylariomycetidae sp. FL0641]